MMSINGAPISAPQVSPPGSCAEHQNPQEASQLLASSHQPPGSETLAQEAHVSSGDQVQQKLSTCSRRRSSEPEPKELAEL